jgi:hypothetical protein
VTDALNLDPGHRLPFNLLDQQTQNDPAYTAGPTSACKFAVLLLEPLCLRAV